MSAEALPSLNQDLFLRANAFASATFHIPVYFALSETPHPARLEEAFSRCAEKHELLRTSFVRASPSADPGDGDMTYRRQVDEAAAALLEVHTLGTDITDRFAAASQLAMEHLRQPFDAQRPPAARLLVISDACERPVMQLVIHHLIADGWSIRRLIRDVNDAYAGRPLRSDHPDDMTFSAFALWERHQLAEGRWNGSIDYWRQQWTQYGDSLVGPEALGISTTDEDDSHDGAWEECSLDDHAFSRLTAFCRLHQVTPYAAILTALFALLHRETGASRLALLTSLANRTGGTEDIVGPLCNTNLLGVQCSPRMTLLCLLRDVTENVLNAVANQAIPAPVVAEIFSATMSSRAKSIQTYTPLACDALDVGIAAARPGDLVIGVARPLVPAPHRVWRIRLAASRTRASIKTSWPINRMARPAVARVLAQLVHMCHVLIDNPSATLSSLHTYDHASPPN